MKNLQKVVAVQDESSHWYVIPMKLEKKFDEMIEQADGEWDVIEKEFEELFNKYRTGGALNNTQLWAEL